MKQYKYSAPDDLRAALRARAIEEDASESQIVRRAIRLYLAAATNGNGADSDATKDGA